VSAGTYEIIDDGKVAIADASMAGGQTASRVRHGRDFRIYPMADHFVGSAPGGRSVPNTEKLHKDTYPNRKRADTSVEEPMAAEADALDGWLTPIIEALAKIPDPRNPQRVTHKLIVVLVFGVWVVSLRYPSQRAGTREFTEPKRWTTLQAAFPQLDSISHMDTIARVLEEIPASEVEEVLTSTLKRWRRNRRLERWMVQQRYLVAVGGTLKWRGIVRHAEEMLEKRPRTGTRAFRGMPWKPCWWGPKAWRFRSSRSFARIRPTVRRTRSKIRRGKPFVGWPIGSRRGDPNCPSPFWLTVCIRPDHSLPSSGSIAGTS